MEVMVIKYAKFELTCRHEAKNLITTVNIKFKMQ